MTYESYAIVEFLSLIIIAFMMFKVSSTFFAKQRVTLSAGSHKFVLHGHKSEMDPSVS